VKEAATRLTQVPNTGTTPALAGDDPLTTSRRRHGTPRISIIVPALNEEKLIERTLACFPLEVRRNLNMELIVSDGGSTDRTLEIARQHADIVVEHLANRRQTIAEGRNRGAERATGDLLVFINADTLPRDPSGFVQGLKAFADTLSDDRTVVAIACPVEIAPEERGLTDRLFHGFFNNYVRLLNLVGLGMGRGECQVIRRDAFVKAGGYEDQMAAGEDFDLYKRLTQYGTIGHRSELGVYESPRRFRRYGYLRVLFEWTINALAVMILRRSISKEWEEIR
jgi:glycosyltransferase involved in cell wall biosynthesis